MECDDMDAEVDLLLDEVMQKLPEEEFLAPEGFEELVMRRIRALPEVRRGFNSLDSLLCVVWGAFSCLFGLGFLAVINRGAIMEYMTDSAVLGEYAETFDTLSAYIDDAAAAAAAAAGNLIAAVSGYVTASRYVLMLIIAVLAMIQYVVYRKNKVKA